MSKSSREIALGVLLAVDMEGAYSNIALNKHIDSSISRLDENLIRELVYGVLENRMYLDWIIKKFSKIKVSKIEPKVLEILRLGVYQIVFMDKIPDSAAVNESVKIAKKNSHKGTSGFVNAILRNVSREKDNIREIKVNNICDYISIKYSHPSWLVKKFICDYGEEFTENLCKANNEKPSLNIRVNTLRISRENLIKVLEERGFIVSDTKYAFDGLIIENPNRITETEEFKNGYFIIQDESSMLVSQVMNPREGSFVLDICSAPGGKTTHMAQKMNNNGKIVARDVYEHKLKLIDDNSKRLGINIIETQMFDALKLDASLVSKADYCLVDAPCSGFGLIRRRPEIKWNRKEDDIKNIINMQYNILENGSKYVKDGGILIYSTCTILKEENVELVKSFLDNNKEFQLVGFNDLLKSGDKMETAKEGFLQLYPHIHKTDGFFIAKMRKKDR